MSYFAFLTEHGPTMLLGTVTTIKVLICATILYVIISLIFGTIVAISFTYISPATENDNLVFVFFCGIIGISGMMLPGLSGSFILILLGNYELLLVKAVTDINILLLSVFFAGSVFGVFAFDLNLLSCQITAICTEMGMPYFRLAALKAGRKLRR